MFNKVFFGLLLSLWSMTLLAPAAVSRVQGKEKGTIVMNLTEEEGQETARDTTDDEQLSKHVPTAGWSQLARVEKKHTCHSQDLISMPAAEIILPPPEYSM